MKKEDRNTFLTIGIILLVCIIALVAILNIVWNIMKPLLNSTTNATTSEIRAEIIETDYNFEIEVESVSNKDNDNELNQEQEKKDYRTILKSLKTLAKLKQDIQSESPQITPNIEETNHESPIEQLNYNFEVPENNLPSEQNEFEDTSLQNLPDEIVNDAIFAEQQFQAGTTQINMQIKIPKIGVDAPVVQGFGASELLKIGFWVHPASYNLGQGEFVLLCHRRYFGPNHPKSCWYLDKLEIGDEISFDLFGEKLTYNVVGTNVFDSNDPVIYTMSPYNDYVKIVTCHPLYSNEQRLVVLAERI
ncbi:MAG: hypothetical protein KatS3mg085_550 [Candidatus Dojkabacteria bacterium]|nr:MAG: hypothetical protein KatS3mg085_550 [Candidatus Dojkabacteria bacterium]